MSWDTDLSISSTQFFRMCNCCLYNGVMVADGGSVELASGELGKCCKGEIEYPAPSPTCW